MYAKYIKKEIADLNGTGQTQAYYKMKTQAMGHDDFIDLCCREGAMPRDAILGVLTLIHEKLALSMAEGYSVKIDGLGTFSAKLGMRDGVLPDAFEPGETKHNVKAIKVTGVSYRPDNELITDTARKCHLVKDGESRIKKPSTTLEERTAMARKYLERMPMMRVMDYAMLTGLSRTTASMELRKIASDPDSGIISLGQNSQKYYTLRLK
jgi:predicted histone-like DNA-binding protein